jgi:peptide/nickel transport system substrate-binding protein
MMPRRMAETDPNAQITEAIGSGPFRFVRNEFVSGSRVVYSRFEGYVPRSEPAEWATGGKVAHFDRVEWVVISDPATASAALQAGEVDWWENPLADLLPLLARNRAITIETIDPIGNMPVMRFNHLQPPFNNVAMRRAVLGAVVQQDYIRAVMGGNEALGRECYSTFPCGTPLESDVGAEVLRTPRDLERSKTELRQAGYSGEKIVIISAGDQPNIHPQSQVTFDLLRRLGTNVELITTDWGTMLQRRNSQEPVERGGWSIFHTTWVGGDIIDPAVSAPLRGNGTAGWAGWATNPEIETLRTQWLAAENEAEQRRIAAAIQRAAFAAVPFIPLGMFRNPTAYRSNLSGVLKGPAPLMWNVRKS